MAFDIGDAREQYSLPARDCIIANNLIVSDRASVSRLVSEPENWTWTDNIVHATLADAEFGITVAEGGMRFIDPLLRLVAGLWKPDVISKVSREMTARTSGRMRSAMLRRYTGH